MRKRLWLALTAFLLVGVVGLVLAGSVFHLFKGPLVCQTWQSKAMAPLEGTTEFTSLSLLSASDVWLAGRNTPPGGASSRPLMEHWDGKQWQTLFPPEPGPLDGTLKGIAAVSDTDVWVVGSAYTDPGNALALAAHWDGHNWRLFPSPSASDSPSNNPTGYRGFGQLNSVTALASDNVWAVGSLFEHGFTQTLIEHWNGSTWQRVKSPNIADENNQLTGISSHSADDLWAVGTSQGYEGSALTLTEHWNGSRWGIVSSPNPSRSFNSLSSVAAAAPDDVWVVGVMAPAAPVQVSPNGPQSIRDPVSIRTDGLIIHWDGQHWQVVPFPKLGQHQILTSITAYSSKEVWAVGLFVTESDQGQALHGLLEQWNGSAWQSREDPHAQYLASIATSAAGGLWSVGLTVPSRSSSISEQAIAQSCQ